jgi:hypothetical protein
VTAKLQQNFADELKPAGFAAPSIYISPTAFQGDTGMKQLYNRSPANYKFYDFQQQRLQHKNLFCLP